MSRSSQREWMTDGSTERAAQRLSRLNERVTQCRRCPRLVAWREEVALRKRAAYADETYWGRAVPAFGDPAARVLIVGLAPAAHGANRTGRMFTGDRSGDWLFDALHRAGFANQAKSLRAGDGLELRGAYLSAAVRCAPPDNKPTPEERGRCSTFLEEELEILENVCVLVCLGGFAFSQTLRVLAAGGIDIPRPRPRFGHGVEFVCGDSLVVLASFHPSQQNTFTGRLTRPMFDSIWDRAKTLAADQSVVDSLLGFPTAP